MYDSGTEMSSWLNDGCYASWERCRVIGERTVCDPLLLDILRLVDNDHE